MKFFRFSSLLLAALLATPAATAQRIHDVVVTTDGSEYAGYISYQDQKKGQITVKADYLIRSLSPAKCRVGEERTISFAQLSPEAQDWYRKQSTAELAPDTPVSIRDVQETAPGGTLWRDAFVLEEGRIIKFIVFGRSFQLDADDVKAIRHAERPAEATEGIVDVFITRGLTVPEVEGQLIEESVGEFYRVLIKGTDGSRDRVINISADNVLSRNKRPLNPEVSLYRQAPLVDEVRTASGESIRGVIATMDMGREELVVVTETGVSRIVKAADVASITSAPAVEFPASSVPASAELSAASGVPASAEFTAASGVPASAELAAASGVPSSAELAASSASTSAELAASSASASAELSAALDASASAELAASALISGSEAPVLGASASSSVSAAPPAEPAVVAEEPAETEEPAQAEEPAQTEEEPAQTEEEPAQTEEEPAQAEEESTETASEPAETEEPTEAAEEDPEEQFFEQDPDDSEDVAADEEAETVDDEEVETPVSSAQTAAEHTPSPSSASPTAPTTIPVPASAAKAQFYVCKKPVTPVEVIALPNGYWSLQGEAVAIEHKGNDAYIEVPAGVASNDAIEVYPLTETNSNGTAYPNAFSLAESTKAPRIKVASSQRPVPGHKRLTFQLTTPGRYAIYRPADKMVMWFEWK